MIAGKQYAIVCIIKVSTVKCGQLVNLGKYYTVLTSSISLRLF